MAILKVIVNRKEEKPLQTGDLEYGDVGVDNLGRHYVKVYVSLDKHTYALLENGENTYGSEQANIPLEAIHRRNSGTVIEMTL